MKRSGSTQSAQNDWRIFADRVQDRIIWVFHGRKCVSFHQEPGFTRIRFKSDYELLDYVFKLVEHGYLFQ